MKIDELALEQIDERCREEVLGPAARLQQLSPAGLEAPVHLIQEGERRELAAALREGATLDFLPETRAVREAAWRVAAPRADYLDRRVEITGPSDRKLVINALNSGARGFMADFEDANSPTWRNQVSGQANLIDSIDGTITYTDHRGRAYRLGEQTATLMMRPRSCRGEAQWNANSPKSNSAPAIGSSPTRRWRSGRCQPRGRMISVAVCSPS